MNKKFFFIGFLILSLFGFIGIFPAAAQMTADVDMIGAPTNYFHDIASGTGASGVPAVTELSVGGTVTWHNVSGAHTVTTEAALGTGVGFVPPVACGTG